MILKCLWEDQFISTANWLYFRAVWIPPQIWVLAEKQAVDFSKFTLSRGPKPKRPKLRGQHPLSLHLPTAKNCSNRHTGNPPIMPVRSEVADLMVFESSYSTQLLHNLRLRRSLNKRSVCVSEETVSAVLPSFNQESPGHTVLNMRWLNIRATSKFPVFIFRQLCTMQCETPVFCTVSDA